MSTVWEELSERIRGEVEELDRIVRRTEEVWQKACRNIGEQDIYLDSVALSLHGFYSGIEKLPICKMNIRVKQCFLPIHVIESQKGYRL